MCSDNGNDDEYNTRIVVCVRESEIDGLMTNCCSMDRQDESTLLCTVRANPQKERCSPPSLLWSLLPLSACQSLFPSLFLSPTPQTQSKQPSTVPTDVTNILVPTLPSFPFLPFSLPYWSSFLVPLPLLSNHTEGGQGREGGRPPINTNLPHIFHLKSTPSKIKAL